MPSLDRLIENLPAQSWRWDCKYYLLLVALYFGLVTCFMFILPQLYLPSTQFYVVESAALAATVFMGFITGKRDNSEAEVC